MESRLACLGNRQTRSDEPTMSTERIRSALGVDTWPPDHYAILGLTPGPVDAADVEQRARERTERLRTYQLAEPDAATDALNRVAQALVCLTDTATKRTYDDARQKPASEPPESANVDRRATYRTLSAARQLRAAWARLGPLLNDAPARSLDRAASADLLRQLWLIRRGVDRSDIPNLADGAGHLIVSLARRPRILRTARAFGEHDRKRVAADWAAGSERIERHFQELSATVRRPRYRALRVLSRRLKTYALDWFLVLIGALALGIALFRTI